MAVTTNYDIAAMSPGGGDQLKRDSTVVNLADKAEEYLGQKGMVIIADNNAHTPGTGKCFTALQMLSDTVLAAITADTSAPITGTITGITLGTNVVIFGKLVSVTLTSGSCIAYLGLL